MIITIDGPTASGKSTVAKNLAEKLGIYHLNTGLLYRGLAYLLINQFHYDQKRLKNPDKTDVDQILQKFVYCFDRGAASVLFDGKDITPDLKNSEIDFYSSIISQNIQVRKDLLSFQRGLGNQFDLVIEGRDCGSVVFPNADLKIYLTADLRVRAIRWQKYMELKGKNFSLDECIKAISDRDERDKTREISPLIVPENAVIIDSSNLTEEEVLDKIISLYKNIKGSSKSNNPFI